MKVEKEKFDALLKRMIAAKPTTTAKIAKKTNRKKKLGKIIPTASQ